MIKEAIPSYYAPKMLTHKKKHDAIYIGFWLLTEFATCFEKHNCLISILGRQKAPSNSVI